MAIATPIVLLYTNMNRHANHSNTTTSAAMTSYSSDGRKRLDYKFTKSLAINLSKMTALLLAFSNSFVLYPLIYTNVWMGGFCMHNFFKVFVFFTNIMSYLLVIAFTCYYMY